jgi:sporulation protein YlmC with PRC-barrel domain
MYGVVSASKIIGEAVINRRNEELGEIHELVIDAKEGRLAYAVLSFGGVMGVGNKFFALPWKAFEFATTENKLILDIDREKLTAAPGFDSDAKWPDFADRTWVRASTTTTALIRIGRCRAYDPGLRRAV